MWTKDLQDLSNADKHNHLLSLGTRAEVQIKRSEVVSFDAETSKGSVRVYFDAEIDEIAFQNGRAVTDTLEGLCTEVVETIALLKGCMKFA